MSYWRGGARPSPVDRDARRRDDSERRASQDFALRGDLLCATGKELTP